MALYQYLPPTSCQCHPPDALTGLMFGQVLQIFQLCSRDQDINLELAAFYHRLLDRGYKAVNIISLLIKGINNANYYLSLTEAQQEKVKKSQMGRADKRVFFYLPFHPQNSSSGIIQRLWRDLILSPSGKESLNLLKNWNNYPVPVKRLNIAYHQKPNLANLLSYRNLTKRMGLKASLFLPGTT
jgi:hypothetical protein